LTSQFPACPCVFFIHNAHQNSLTILQPSPLTAGRHYGSIQITATSVTKKEVGQSQFPACPCVFFIHNAHQNSLTILQPSPLTAGRHYGSIQITATSVTKKEVGQSQFPACPCVFFIHNAHQNSLTILQPSPLTAGRHYGSIQIYWVLIDKPKQIVSIPCLPLSILHS
jgi:hypothetical protein